MLKVFVWILVFFLIAGAWLIWSLLRRTLFSRRVERALRDFVRDRDEIQETFLRAAGASGKPRGLAWKQCDFQDSLLLAHDRANGDLIGLVGVTVSFEAIKDGGMEEVDAVGNLRAATAVLTWKNGQWTTQGRVVFNLEPREVLEHYKDSLSPL